MILPCDLGAGTSPAKSGVIKRVAIQLSPWNEAGRDCDPLLHFYEPDCWRGTRRPFLRFREDIPQ